MKICGPRPTVEAMEKRLGKDGAAKAKPVLENRRHYFVEVWITDSPYPHLEWVRENGQMKTVEVPAVLAYHRRGDGKTSRCSVCQPLYMFHDPVTLQPLANRPETE